MRLAHLALLGGGVGVAGDYVAIRRVQAHDRASHGGALEYEARQLVRERESHRVMNR
jgi:hypothetical protein